MIWKQSFTLETINQLSQRTLVEALGIEFIAFGDDYLTARMPVDDRTVQPMRLLHGGASAALAETLGSVASVACLEDVARFMPVGVELNANHLRSAASGFVHGTVKPFRIGRSLHVWGIEIKDEMERLICVSRLTIAIVPRSK
ncbi:MAG TPA: hotdog fold thioesterase [Saprospiraceae bacterium]|nr:hotdog fold thioesterase [Saprospiraceae bacterium]HMP15025.1 hotdog fold thioesterase [Saprospiraceae bacterium]